MRKYVFDPATGFDPEFSKRGVSIWRYMDLPKFLWLLDKKALFLSRLDCFEDRFEGSSPLSLIERRRAWTTKKLRADSPAVIETARRNTAVNCWHMNEGESVAMWKLYSLNNFGVAVRSTIGGLAKSLPPVGGEDLSEAYTTEPKVLPLHIRLVRYINFSQAQDSPPSPWELALYKRTSFSFEQEIRLIAQGHPYRGDPTDYTIFPSKGDFVPVELPSLIKAVYVAPNAPPWYSDLIVSAVRRTRLKVEIHQSDLGRDPVF
jgi:hypothetical protein